MEAARIAAMRGHEVTLCEQGPRLGGALLLASITNRRIKPVLDHMRREIDKLPLEVRLNTHVTSALVERLKPDVVVLATGGTPSTLEVPGSNSDIVLDRADVQAVFSGHALSKGGTWKRLVSYLAALFIRYFYNPALIRWLLKFRFPFGKRVVVIGGNFAGIELADTLASRGKKVTIVEESKRLGADIEITHRWVFLSSLKKAGARMLKEARLLEIAGNRVKVSQNDSIHVVEADTVVKVGIAPNAGAAEKLRGTAPEVHVVGDCADPGKLMEAVASGFLTGQKI
jgi:2,4-dienoyl-CoA reductase (NADPH2)